MPASARSRSSSSTMRPKTLMTGTRTPMRPVRLVRRLRAAWLTWKPRSSMAAATRRRVSGSDPRRAIEDPRHRGKGHTGSSGQVADGGRTSHRQAPWAARSLSLGSVDIALAASLQLRCGNVLTNRARIRSGYVAEDHQGVAERTWRALARSGGAARQTALVTGAAAASVPPAHRGSSPKAGAWWAGTSGPAPSRTSSGSASTYPTGTRSPRRPRRRRTSTRS